MITERLLLRCTRCVVTSTTPAATDWPGTPRRGTALSRRLAVNVAKRLGNRPTASRHPATTRVVSPVAGGLRMGSSALAFLPSAADASPPRHQGVAVGRSGEEMRWDCSVHQSSAASEKKRRWRTRRNRRQDGGFEVFAGSWKIRRRRRRTAGS
jgi:hypothetical protein